MNYDNDKRFLRYSRRLECLRQLVLQLASWVDGVNAHDGNADRTIGPNVLRKKQKIIKHPVAIRWMSPTHIDSIAVAGVERILIGEQVLDVAQAFDFKLLRFAFDDLAVESGDQRGGIEEKRAVG